MHKLGCQDGASANWLLPGGLGLCSKKKRVGGDGRSGAKWVTFPVCIPRNVLLTLEQVL